jgi:site-specific DNA-methyltransferase (adenine-specific)
MDNTLYYGDNLEILRKYIKDESVDLIYLDPPFNSKANYNVLFKDESGESKAQIQAFTDFWHWDEESAKTYDYLITNPKVPTKVSNLISAFHSFLGQNQMSAYLVMMAVRLIELHRVLKSSGLLYLHCDPTASHYLKILLDVIFGEENFRNEIVWCYAGGGIPKKDFPNKHDIIFRYSKDDGYFYQPEYHEYSERTIKIGGGRHSLTSGGGILDLERGTPINDWWADLPKLTSYQKEWLGYPTQKPLGLLERIVKTSSKDGDIVLDPFCGCGTTIDATNKINKETHTNRTWIGIDITHLAINLIKRRINERYLDCKFDVIGEPKDIEGARDLALKDRYQFEWWALSLIDARPANDKKKGADQGVDGIILLRNPNMKEPIKTIVQVKSGHVKSDMITALKGAMERDKAKYAVFITLEEPTQPMIKEALEKGFETEPLTNEKIPKVEIITIKELLEGKTLKLQQVYDRINITYQKAKKDKPKDEKGYYKKF